MGDDPSWVQVIKQRVLADDRKGRAWLRLVSQRRHDLKFSNRKISPEEQIKLFITNVMKSKNEIVTLMKQRKLLVTIDDLHVEVERGRGTATTYNDCFINAVIVSPRSVNLTMCLSL